MDKVTNLTDYKLRKAIEESCNNVMANKRKRERLLRDLFNKKKKDDE